MSKHIKIILILSGISLFLVFYIVLSVKRVTVTNENTALKTEMNYEKNEVEKISQEQIMANYQTSISALWSDYENTLKNVKELSFSDTLSDSLVTDYNDKIVKLRIEAMSYVVPSQYKDMHLKLVMSLSSLKTYLDTQLDEEKERALSLYVEAKNEYQNL